MLNSKIILETHKIIQFKEKKIKLKIPKFIDFIKYSSTEFENIDERVEYLYNFFDINFKEFLIYIDDMEFTQLFFSDLVSSMHSLLMNFDDKIELKETKQIKKSGYVIKDVDIVYVISKFCNFYNYKYNEVLELPLPLFFDMYSKIEVIVAEQSLEMLDLILSPALLETEKGAKIVSDLKESKKDKLNSIYELELINNAESDLQEIRDFFNQNEVGGFYKGR